MNVISGVSRTYIHTYIQNEKKNNFNFGGLNLGHSALQSNTLSIEPPRNTWKEFIPEKYCFKHVLKVGQ